MEDVADQRIRCAALNRTQVVFSLSKAVVEYDLTHNSTKYLEWNLA